MFWMFLSWTYFVTEKPLWYLQNSPSCLRYNWENRISNLFQTLPRHQPSTVCVFHIALCFLHWPRRLTTKACPCFTWAVFAGSVGCWRETWVGCAGWGRWPEICSGTWSTVPSGSGVGNSCNRHIHNCRSANNVILFKVTEWGWLHLKNLCTLLCLASLT